MSSTNTPPAAEGFIPLSALFFNIRIFNWMNYLHFDTNPSRDSRQPDLEHSGSDGVLWLPSRRVQIHQPDGGVHVLVGSVSFSGYLQRRMMPIPPMSTSGATSRMRMTKQVSQTSRCRQQVDTSGYRSLFFVFSPFLHNIRLTVTVVRWPNRTSTPTPAVPGESQTSDTREARVFYGSVGTECFVLHGVDTNPPT